MPRSPIRSRGQDIISDNGAVLISLAKGEQIQKSFTCDWLTDLSGFTIEASVVEGANLPGDGTEVPLTEKASTPDVTELSVIKIVGNTFTLIFPEDLADAWGQDPSPDDPVYGFFAISIADTGIGQLQQIRVPVRGLIEIVYNPLERAA